MLVINSSISIPEHEIDMSFVRSSGPGGQNVNKVATAVQLRFDIWNSSSLRKDVKGRLAKLAGNRVTKDGVLLIEASRYRTQDQNREDARKRLAQLVRRALRKPKKRKKTRPSAAQKERRLRAKKKRSQIKKQRRSRPEDW